MQFQKIALISQSSRVRFTEIAPVAAAIAKQIREHFSPVWLEDALISPFAKLDQVPDDYWIVAIVADHPNGAAGVHQGKDNKGRPYAIVHDDEHWSVTASHEILEMLVDPTLDAFRRGIDPDEKAVEYLTEVCDPCQAVSYPIDGVYVSDFVTPSFYDKSSTQKTFTYWESISRPLTVAIGGYLVWRDIEKNQMLYLSDSGGGQTIRSLPDFDGGFKGLPSRCWVDAQLRSQSYTCSPEENSCRRKEIRKHKKLTKQISRNRFNEIQENIAFYRNILADLG